MSIWSIALTLFLVANPIGNTPAFISLLRHFDFERQRHILLREAGFSLLIALAFLYIGKEFLQLINIQQYAVNISGGTLLLLVALDMIFPPKFKNTNGHKTQEPFVVPIATPLIAGGGVLSTIMIYSAKEQNNLKLTGAILIAWSGVFAVLACISYLNKFLGKQGLLALEQLMGMILSMIAIEIIVKGLYVFFHTLH